MTGLDLLTSSSHHLIFDHSFENAGLPCLSLTESGLKPNLITLLRLILTRTFRNGHVDTTLVVHLSDEGSWILCQPHLLLLASSSSSSAFSSPPLLRPSAPGLSTSCCMALCICQAHAPYFRVPLPGTTSGGFQFTSTSC